MARFVLVLAAMETLPELRARHAREEKRLLARVLAAHGWNLSRAAVALGVSVSSLQRALGRHPDLEERRAELGPGPGRPQPTRTRK